MGATFIELVVILTGVIVASLIAGAVWEWWGGWWAIAAWPIGFCIGLVPFLLIAAVLDLIALFRKVISHSRHRRR